MTIRRVGVEEELRRGRSLAAEVAGRVGARVAALATSPVHVEPQMVRKGRYLQMAHAFGLTAYEQLTCGCHVHVSIGSPDEGVAVIDRIRPWLPVLLALSANSPFWQERDGAYASFRYQAWSRAGAGPRGNRGTPPAGGPGCTRLPPRDAAPGRLAGQPSGLEDVLLNPHTGLPQPASAVAYTLLEHVTDALNEAGEADTITELLRAVVARGNGAAFQRSARRDGSLASVIEAAAAITVC